MPNLDFITDRLATGGDLPAPIEGALRDLQAWQDLGITHVVDNRLEYSDAEFVAEWAPDITYLHNGVDDAGQQMPDEWFDQGVDFVLDALAQPDTRVLVHCHMGINRGPSLAYASLLALGTDPVEAIDMVRSARPIAGNELRRRRPRLAPPPAGHTPCSAPRRPTPAPGLASRALD